MGHTKESRQRAWSTMQNRRNKWFKEAGPCVSCGSSHNLQLDHKDPSTKTSHNIWSWEQTRMETELQKCQVLCIECHKLKTRWQSYAKMKHGAYMYKRLKCKCPTCVEAQCKRNKKRRRA